ncbi:rhodanese-like domain-containing protein [Erythrobacter alti]|uniref:rhodanese-like domain-containing protein n=1 Tax=Erythrobacter alti TaxID=1896145 RepID=UPI0030F49F9F
MRNTLFVASVALAASCLAIPAHAQENEDAAGVDYAGFVDLAKQIETYRQTRLLDWIQFDTRSREPDAIILDTRSAAAFAQGHVRGAVNLPFSDFTEEKLEEIIGDRQRPIFIYCNNNFADDRQPVQLKRVELALNIPTFINLYGYGYREIWELGEVLMLEQVDWVRAEG